MKQPRWKSFAISICALMILGISGYARGDCGVLGCVLEGVGRATGIKPIEDLGRNADEELRKIKEHNPGYKAVEEGATEAVKRPFTVACTVPYQTITNAVIANCSNWDGRTNDQHLIESAKSILIKHRIFQPSDFEGIQIRWCPLSNAHGMAPDRGRIYLDVSHKNETEDDLAILLAHEMKHVMQYRRMGTDNFKCEYSKYYVECGGCQNDRHPLEHEAYTFEESVSNKLANDTQVESNPNFPAPTPLSQNPFPQSQPTGYPSGYGMKVCGCWGANPAAQEMEPRCASGRVRINVCPGACAPGHPPYAYVCL